jgi:hypothetical protein
VRVQDVMLLLAGPFGISELCAAANSFSDIINQTFCGLTIIANKPPSMSSL